MAAAAQPPAKMRAALTRRSAFATRATADESGVSGERPLVVSVTCFEDNTCYSAMLGMAATPGLKAALKRGALLAAANWPLVIVQFVTESSLKLMLAVPIVGGAFLVALLLDMPLPDLLRGDLRDISVSILKALAASPAALITFIASIGLVFVAGSVLQFIVKGGTVALLAEAERVAGPVERPPLMFEAIRRAEVVSI